MSKKRDIYKLWGLKLLILFLISLPNFTSWILNQFEQEILPGLSNTKIIYFLVVVLIILAINGKRVLFFGIAAASIISSAVVFSGSIISLFKKIINFSDFKFTDIFEYSPHYIARLITMLTVITLAIAIISTMPFPKYEKLLLQRMRGISMFEKTLLMAARVFNHVVFTVIPNILLVKKEEEMSRKTSFKAREGVEDLVIDKGKKNIIKLSRFIFEFISIGVAGICGAIEFIPSWALEIANLPGKKDIKSTEDKNA